MRSSLGQPLHIVVELIDVSAGLDADCFRLSPASLAGATPEGARLALVRSSGRTALHVRTPDSVSDPVVQFVLGTECDVRMQREYVLLLDPPELAPVEETIPQIAVPAAEPRVREARPSAARVATPPVRSARPRPAAEATPRLILSGKRHLAGGPASRFALKLDTTLPDPARIGQAMPALTPTELSDENTALSRKLAHLETQLTELHQRNAELEARQTTAVKTPPPAPAGPSRWPLALLLIGLLAGIVVLVAWLRRRTSRTPTVITPAIAPVWAPAGEPATPADSEPMPADDTLESAPVRRLDLISMDTAEAGTEVKEDILDQAEVFVAHGHGDFAIHLLQEHLRAAPMESPIPWLLLLDLQHRAGDTEGYTATSAECRRYFNINLSGHPISQDGDEPGPGLEAYPHLLNKLVAVWNTPEVDAFINELIYDDRGGTRMGFEPGAYRDILLLRDISKQSQFQVAKPGERAAAA